MNILNAGNRARVFLVLLALCVVSCTSYKVRTERLTPYRSAVEIRFDDIKEQIALNPVKAIDLIGTYRATYRITGAEDEAADLVTWEQEAVENLRGFLEKAIAEERWDAAASYSRSLASIEPDSRSSTTTVREPDLILAGAKKKLKDGDNLGAFLSAVQAHGLRPLSVSDAMLFFDRAVEVKQRRTAACFLAAVEQAGGGGGYPPRRANTPGVPTAYRPCLKALPRC